MLTFIVLLCWVVKFMPKKNIGEEIAKAREKKAYHKDN